MTNLRTAYQAGRWTQVQRTKVTRPYLQYKHSDSVTHPRPLHMSWDGLVIPVDDPWWQAHWPPNGWGCKCRAFALSERDLQRMGKAGPDTPPDNGTVDWVDKTTGEVHEIPAGIDPGWDYAPGASRTELLRRELGNKAEQLSGPLSRALRGDLARRATDEGPLIPLRGLDVEYAEGVHEVLAAFAVRNAEGHLPHGVRKVAVEDMPGTISGTDQRGYFVLSRAALPALGGRSGFESITAALTKIRDGKPLDFHEEYGIESLWHEILHNSQQHPVAEAAPGQRRLIEALHQIIARQTYPDLLAALGTKPTHLRAVREHGPAYAKNVGILTALLRDIGIMGDDFVISADNLAELKMLDFETRPDEMPEKLGQMLVEKKGGRNMIEEAIKRIMEEKKP